jgi:hypothetical protein
VLQRILRGHIPHILECVPRLGLRCGLKPPIVDLTSDTRCVVTLLFGTLKISDSVLVREWRIVSGIVQ